MIVFKLDGWTLENAIIGDGSYPHMVVKHACSPHMDGRELLTPSVHVYLDGDKHCWRCAEAVPEGITALYVLHEWDKP